MLASFKRKLTDWEVRRLRDCYLSLMESCLTGIIYEDQPLKASGAEIYDVATREVGRDWPSMAHTMIGIKRLANLRMLAETVIANEIPGDFIETGVWRGDACILMRAVLNAYQVTDRRVWVADSFQGVPPPDLQRYRADAESTFHTFEELLAIVTGAPLPSPPTFVEDYGATAFFSRTRERRNVAADARKSRITIE